MSKELEALKELEIGVHDEWDGTSWIEDKLSSIKILKKLLTPPTAEEVCEALSDWLLDYDASLWSYDIHFDDYGFRYENNKGYEVYIARYNKDKGIAFFDFLPPHLITLIGRFYEGIEANE